MIVTGWQLLAILALVSSSAVALTAWACGRLHAGDAAVMRAELAMLRAENEQLADNNALLSKQITGWRSAQRTERRWIS